MNVEEFNNLTMPEKQIRLFEAQKIAERLDEFSKYELFYFDNLFIETRTSLLYLYKRTMTGYTLRDLPLVYAGNLGCLWSNTSITN